ncbi:hypothetical protein [Methanobrevibacter sp.]
MNKKRIIFGGAIAIIAILSVGMVMAVSDTNKTATKISINAKSPVHEGDKIKIKLTDVNNTPIPKQTVHVRITDEDNTAYWSSVKTSKKGVAYLDLDKVPGEYNVKCKFKGNDKYNSSFKIEKITVEGYEEEIEDNDDSGAYYSEQAGDVIYTGEVHEGPDGNWYMHVGDNEWIRI